MSAINVDTIRSRTGTAPQLDKGVEVVAGYGITGAGGINVSGACTASAGFIGDLTGTASDATYTSNSGYSTSAGISSGLTGSPDITVNYGTGQLGINIQGAGSTTTTLNVTGVSTVGTLGVSVGTTSKDLKVTGISTLGVTSVTNFTASGTLVEAFSSTTTAYSSSGDLNISNGNLQFCSANLGGTNNTLNIMSTTGINTDLAIGEALNVTAITAVNAATAYVNQITIDGKAVTETWVGGSAPTDGGSSGYDTYSFNILKTGSETFICIANQVKTS